VQGLGLAVLPLYLVATDLQEGRLVEVRSEAPPVPAIGASRLQSSAAV
jgi:DNA-binding transcriptional LysR family regulator